LGGFSLAEVVVALTLFTLAAFVLGRTVVDNLHVLYLKRGFDEGYVLAEVRREILTRTSRSALEGGGEMEVVTPRRGGMERGETENRTVRVRWEVEILPTKLLDVHSILAEVRTQAGDDPAVYSFQLFAYRPGWSERETQTQLEGVKEQEFRRRSEARGESTGGGP
jgi:hypothetical protein